MSNEAGMKLTGTRILVRIDALENVSRGGIVIAASRVDKEQSAQTNAVLIDASEDAWKCSELKGAKVGDPIFFGRYAGSEVEFKKKGKIYRIMDARSVLAVLEEPMEKAWWAADEPEFNRDGEDVPLPQFDMRV